ncbi:MAG TPA: NAD(P)-dependent oxidoreductase [Candidatus Dormibacteraeota bacterium]|nr:NAD(P)-dependent oxidoreductase [Candidatus Dormibacteraeota bacterium]
MAEHALIVCHTGARPPEWVDEVAAGFGVRLVSLGAAGASVRSTEEAAGRLALLRPGGYLMNHPWYGPYLSVEAADAACGGLRIVTYMGATREARVYDTFFDVAGLRRRGVLLTSPALPSLAVAESALTLLFALELGLLPAHLEASSGGTGADRGMAIGARNGLLGSTLGVVGLGQIGRLVAQLAASWGMRVICWSRTRRPDLEEEMGIRHVTLPALMEEADHVTIHTPILTTRGLIDHDALARARGINLVNTTSDPGVVDGHALLEALAEGRVRRVAVEGAYPEPLQERLRETGGDRVLLVPAYTSWGNTPREQERTWRHQLETYRALLEGRPLEDELR